MKVEIHQYSAVLAVAWSLLGMFFVWDAGQYHAGLEWGLAAVAFTLALGNVVLMRRQRRRSRGR